MTKYGQFDDDRHRKIGGRVGMLLQKMSNELNQECERVGLWGILGQGTGALLVRPGTKQPYSKHEHIGKKKDEYSCSNHSYILFFMLNF